MRHTLRAGSPGVFVRSDEVDVPHPSKSTNRHALAGPSLRDVPAHPAAEASSTRLLARAVDGNAMLTRITSILGPFNIDRFEYVVGPDADVLVEIGVRGDARQAQRVAAKINRLIGVRDVVIDPTD
jgi:hypothetical protein